MTDHTQSDSFLSGPLTGQLMTNLVVFAFNGRGRQILQEAECILEPPPLSRLCDLSTLALLPLGYEILSRFSRGELNRGGYVLVVFTPAPTWHIVPTHSEQGAKIWYPVEDARGRERARLYAAQPHAFPTLETRARFNVEEGDATRGVAFVVTDGGKVRQEFFGKPGSNAAFVSALSWFPERDYSMTIDQPWDDGD